MTCKDCIGYVFCSRGTNGRTDFMGKDAACNNVEELCNDFKNKADFVKIVKCGECEYREECNKEVYVEGSYTSIYWCSEGRRNNIK